MTSAPWWLVLVTVPLTGAITLSGVWLTGKFNLRRQREELNHAASLELKKELYSRRIEFYFELLPVIDSIMEELPSGWRKGAKSGEDFDSLTDEQADRLAGLLASAQKLKLKADVISSKEVRWLLDQFIWEMDAFLDGRRSPLREVAFAANHLIFEMRIETGVTTRYDEDEWEARGVYCEEY